MALFAVHLSDGPLGPLALGVGFAVAAVLLAQACWRVRDEDVARIALLSAAFFVASSIHVRIGPTSVHLILNALVGVVLGRRAPLAIAVGLLLQAVLIGHGGFTTLGVNAAVIALPALLASVLFGWLAGGRPSRARAVMAGGLTGSLTVVLTAALNAAVLIVGGIEDWRIVAASMIAAYLVLAMIEGVIVGLTAGFLVRVKPELLRLEAGEPPADAGGWAGGPAAPIESTSGRNPPPR